MAGQAEAAESPVAQAIGRVLDVDPRVVRADTPLADLGADAIAVLAIVDALREAGSAIATDSGPDNMDAVRSARTAGELMAVVTSVSAQSLPRQLGSAATRGGADAEPQQGGSIDEAPR